MKRIETVWGASDKEIAERLNAGATIEAAFSEVLRASPDYSNNDQCKVFESQIVIIFSYQIP